MTKQPVIIIGAGRSGTNALRDALAATEQFHTWPCDEINYIWRHGNRDFPTDELAPEHATEAVTDYLHRRFANRAAKSPNTSLLEKTCANSLRVGFVQAVFPEARLVVITRNALDAVSSAIPRWKAPLDIGYLARKTRWVPLDDLVHYAVRYGSSRLRRGSQGRLSTWGPRFEGLDGYVRAEVPLHQICAHQWRACTDQMQRQLIGVPDSHVHRVRYEEFVTKPEEVLAGVAAFAGQAVSPQALNTASAGLHAGSIGAWKSRLSDVEAEEVRRICDTRDLG